MCVQGVRCETLAGADGALDRDVVEEDFVGHDEREILRSQVSAKELWYLYLTSRLQIMTPRGSVLWTTQCAVELLLIHCGKG